MQIEKFRQDLVNLLGKYKDLHLGVVGVGFTDDTGAVRTHAFTLIRTEPKDHEENLIRDAAAKKVSLVVVDLMKGTYGI